MILSKQSMRGVTVIELMVTLAVLAIILTFAIPSFNEFRQRSALQGAGDQIIGFWSNARYEALKNNTLVKVSMKTSGSSFCFGANTTTSTSDTTKCDCFTANSCDVASYPASQSEWKRVRFLGDSDATIGDTSGVIIIDPKRGVLTDSTRSGYWQIASPSGGVDYRLRVNVDYFGRAVACQPSDAGSSMPQYANRRCN